MIRWIALAALLVVPAAAGTLEGRLVTFMVETWDQREAALLVAKGRTVMVGAGVEFGLEPEGFTPSASLVVS